MKRLLCATCFIALLSLCSPKNSNADFLILDMDPSTPPVPGFPPGPATGFESIYRTTPGSTVTVTAYFVPGPGSVVFDAFGIDLNFGTGADAAVLTPVPLTTLAGTVSGAGGAPGSIDLVSALPIGPGSVLASAGLAPMAGYASSLGGVGYFDPVLGFNFGGAGVFPASGTLFDILSQDFTLTGSLGDKITIMPSGIFDPSPGPTPMVPASGRPLLTGSDPLYDALAGFSTPIGFIGGTFVVVPEPNIGVIIVVLTIGLSGAFLRKRSPMEP